MKLKLITFALLVAIVTHATAAKPTSKSISPDLFGIFFEDINYAADGGLYAELLQNRSFEYTPSDRGGWHSLTAWDYVAWGFAYGTVSVETSSPVHLNNPHYAVLNIEDEGKEGIGLRNSGFDGIAVKAGEKYNFSVFLRQLSDNAVPFGVKLYNKKGKLLGETSISTSSKDWKKYAAVIDITQSSDTAELVLLATGKGKVAIDMVSLFPEKTFKNRPNGLRADLAQAVADLQPKFVRFPGGCLVHGDGLGNMYRWKNTIGPVEQRIAQKNIWGYHQTAGLGYFEYFQFCEDMGAKPLPVVPAGVSCQNSGGTWRIGGTGQKGIPQAEMDEYIQEILDLIEWANGPATSKWGAKRAEAGHPKPFNLEYIGIGNEDKITPAFEDRFREIYAVVKAKHPEITIIGTVGPAHSGEDYELGWKIARDLKIPVVDEHYYESPEWFIANQKRYDNYKRSESKVYLGEYASRGNTLFNALAEAVYLTSLERNGDVVTLSSYAPMLAKTGHTQWNPDLIYFDNSKIAPTVNYYVQQLFSLNYGDTYFDNVVSLPKDSTVAASCVRNSKTGKVILKLVNAGKTAQEVNVDLSSFSGLKTDAIKTVLTGAADDKNTFEKPQNVVPVKSAIKLKRMFEYKLPAMSLVVIELKTK